MDEVRRCIEEAEKLRSQLPSLRQDRSREGLLKYFTLMLEVTEKQHNLYSRFRLMGDPESTQTADEMVHVAELHMSKAQVTSMDEFFSTMKDDMRRQIKFLSIGTNQMRDYE